MITSKNLSKITAILICICLIGCGLIVYVANTDHEIAATEYQSKLFGDEIISIDIQADKDKWQSLLDNALSKEWISANVIINGEQYSNVGIRTKGNSSLTQVANSDSDRYSLQIKFNKYEKGQTYYGLDALCVNNMSGDNTYMKDYIAYDIMEYIGVETPLTNYANVAVNGEHYSFGVALERYDQAFLGRAFNTSGGQLYSVKIAMGNREDFENIGQDNQGANFVPPVDAEGMREGFPNMNGGEMPNMTEGENGAARMRGGIGGMGGGSLLYTDDKISSYSSIFDNAVFSKNSDKDKKRVITAIKNLNEGTDLEKYVDVDSTLRYFAAHTVVVNSDSYISNMAQNYYIYEKDGKITILPWDYSLAFGGMQSGSSTSSVNFPIDTPVSGVNMEDRPLLNKLLEVDEYKEKYHAYLQEIAEGYFQSGLYENTIAALDAKINDYAKNDTTALSTYEQYQNSLPVLLEFGNLRAESIMGQLDGTIPSTTDGQKADSSSLIDASSIDLSALGSMGGGMRMQIRNEDGQGVQFNALDGGGNMPDMGVIQQAMQIMMSSGGELTDEVKAKLMELGIIEEQMTMFSELRGGRNGGNAGQSQRPNGNEQNASPDENAMNENQNGPRNGNIPGMNNSNAAPAKNNNMGNVIVFVGLLLLLGGAIFFIAKSRK